MIERVPAEVSSSVAANHATLAVEPHRWGRRVRFRLNGRVGAPDAVIASSMLSEDALHG
jgi:hypothetical protein